MNVLPFVTNRHQTLPIYTKNEALLINNGDTINLILKIHTLDNLRVFLHFDRNDLKELPKEIPHHNILYTDNANIIKKLSENFKFICTGGDMATCESIIYILAGDTLVYKTNIVVSDDILV